MTGVVDGDDAGVGGQGVHLRQPHVGGRADGAGEDDDGGVGAAGAGPDGHGVQDHGLFLTRHGR